jgi:hypothetical protein
VNDQSPADLLLAMPDFTKSICKKMQKEFRRRNTLTTALRKLAHAERVKIQVNLELQIPNTQRGHANVISDRICDIDVETITVESEEPPRPFHWILAQPQKMRKEVVTNCTTVARCARLLATLESDELFRMALILELRLPSGKVNANDMAKRIFLLAGPAPSTPQDKDLLARLRGALTHLSALSK